MTLPTRQELQSTFLKRDRLLLVLPKEHPLCQYDQVPIELLKDYPFMLSKVTNDSEVVELLQKYQVEPNTHFTTWDDYAIMSMVEKGLGIGILSELILKKCPFDIEIRELNVSAFREIGLAFRDKNSLSLATKHFMNYLSFRNE